MTMHPQGSRSRQQRQRVIVTFGGTEHDVSILCLPESAAYRSEQSKQTRSRQQRRSLYPSTRNLPLIPNAALVFERAAAYINTGATHATYSACRTTSIVSQEDEHYAPTDRCFVLGVLNTASDDNNFEQSNNNINRSKVEIAPGYWVTLRGSNETWSAIERGFSRQVQCPCCLQHMLVIEDAAMALCPECRTIVPINDDGNGLGLGAKAIQGSMAPRTPLSSQTRR